MFYMYMYQQICQIKFRKWKVKNNNFNLLRNEAFTGLVFNKNSFVSVVKSNSNLKNYCRTIWLIKFFKYFYFTLISNPISLITSCYRINLNSLGVQKGRRILYLFFHSLITKVEMRYILKQMEVLKSSKINETTTFWI